MPFKEEILLKSDTTDGGVQLSDVIPNIYDMNDGKTIYLRYCTYYPLNNGKIYTSDNKFSVAYKYELIEYVFRKLNACRITIFVISFILNLHIKLR